MKTLIALIFSLCTLYTSMAQSSSELQLQKQEGHIMQYYVSLPAGWTKDKQWPIVVVLEAAEKQFKENLQRFIGARENMPFILLAPIHTDNGNQGRRDSKIFPYSIKEWDYIDQIGDCKFNDEGLSLIISSVQKQYNGKPLIYITGFEAGAHRLWSMVFNHHEMIKAAAPVAGNFINRCVDEKSILKTDKPSTIIQNFVSDDDEYFGPKGVLYSQWLTARSLATNTGIENIGETIVSGKGHSPLPEEVLTFFYSLERK